MTPWELTPGGGGKIGSSTTEAFARVWLGCHQLRVEATGGDCAVPGVVVRKPDPVPPVAVRLKLTATASAGTPATAIEVVNPSPPLMGPAG